MSKIKTLWKLLKDKRQLESALALNIAQSRLFHILPDKPYLKLEYRLFTGHRLNIDSPEGFNEKLQWLKLYDRKPEYTVMVDKYAVKDYVGRAIGNEHIIKTYGVWEKYEDIDFSILPEKFVLKCTHDSGGLYICKNKEQFDDTLARSILCGGLKNNLFSFGREWPYKDVRPRILAEEYLEESLTDKNTNEVSKGLLDYKFYCFNGEPRFLYVGFANIKDGKKHDFLSFYDLDFHAVPFYRGDHAAVPFELSRPKCFDTMIDIARKLSSGKAFVRVDLYSVRDTVYFSELTFTPGSGFSLFDPYEWEKKIGGWITLPEKK